MMICQQQIVKAPDGPARREHHHDHHRHHRHRQRRQRHRVRRRQGRLRRRVRRRGTPQGRRPSRAAAGARAAATAREAVAGADIVVLAVPYSAVADVAAEIAPVAAGKVVIDPTNPLKADYSGLATGGGTVRRRGARPPAPESQGRQGVQHACSPATPPTRGRSAPARLAVRHGRRGGEGRRVRPVAAPSASARSTSARWPRPASSRPWPGSTSASSCSATAAGTRPTRSSSPAPRPVAAA